MARTTTRRPRFSILGLFSGLLLGFGGLILLQQYAIVFPTMGMSIGLLVAGLVLGLVLPAMAGMLGGRRGPASSTPPPAAGFVPTHEVMDAGSDAFESPQAATPVARLDPRLGVQLLDQRDGWAQVLCSNGWSAWVHAGDVGPLAANR